MRKNWRLGFNFTCYHLVHQAFDKKYYLSIMKKIVVKQRSFIPVASLSKLLCVGLHDSCYCNLSCRYNPFFILLCNHKKQHLRFYHDPQPRFPTTASEKKPRYIAYYVPIVFRAPAVTYVSKVIPFYWLPYILHLVRAILGPVRVSFWNNGKWR